VEAEEQRPPLGERLEKIKQRYQTMGTDDPDFDQETFLDEMWGDT
jgi:antitoxin VapB